MYFMYTYYTRLYVVYRVLDKKPILYIYIDIYTGIYIDLYIYNPGEDNIYAIVIFPLKS